MKNSLKLSLVLFIISILLSCSTQKSWVYRPNKTANWGTPSKTEKTIVTLPFADIRKNKNVNRYYLYYLPPFPYGIQRFSVPEGSDSHIFSGLWTNYKPTEDFAKALALELQGSGLFRESYFDFKVGNADYVIQGSIINTDYNGKIFSYCLSYYGSLFWYIGFPAGTVTNSLEIELACVDTSTKTTILKKRYRAIPVSNISWVYYKQNDFNYPTMLQSVYMEFCNDITPLITGRN